MDVRKNRTATSKINKSFFYFFFLHKTNNILQVVGTSVKEMGLSTRWRTDIPAFNSYKWCPTIRWIHQFKMIQIKLLMFVFFVFGMTESASTERRQKPKRAAVISLPFAATNGVRWTQQIIVPVLAMINQTNTYLWLDFQMHTRMPTANNLTKLYQSFGRSTNINEHFLDEQIANQERKIVYQHIESFFNK